MKNKILLIIAIILLSLSISVRAEEFAFPADDSASVEEEKVDIYTPAEESVQPKAEEQPSLPYKQPISKKTLLKKFLLAMLIVGGAPLVLYSGRSFYSRFNNDLEIQTKTNEEKTSLTAPSDIEEASKIFLEKTCWK